MEITEQDKKRRTDAWENINEGYCPPMSADDHRAKADEHDKRANELLSGEKKDSHIIAARAFRKAAGAIDAANQSSKQAVALD